MRQTLVNDYLEEISTELPEELYGNLSDAICETVCEFDEEVAQLKAENAKLRELVWVEAENAKLRGWCGICGIGWDAHATSVPCAMTRWMRLARGRSSWVSPRATLESRLTDDA